MRGVQRGISTLMILIIFLISGVAVASGYFIFYQNQVKSKSINSFENCAKYYPVMFSYPAQCKTPEGRNFVQPLSEEERKNLIPPSPEPTLDDETASCLQKKNSKIDSQIIQLSLSEDPEQFASSSSLDYKDGKVRVIVETNDKVELSLVDGIVVEKQHENSIRAMVPLDKLCILYKLEEVDFIRPSIKGTAL